MNNTTNLSKEPIGDVFCKGSISLGTGCKRCGRCAVALAEENEALKAARSAPAVTVPLGEPDGLVQFEKVHGVVTAKIARWSWHSQAQEGEAKVYTEQRVQAMLAAAQKGQP